MSRYHKGFGFGGNAEFPAEGRARSAALNEMETGGRRSMSMKRSRRKIVPHVANGTKSLLSESVKGRPIGAASFLCLPRIACGMSSDRCADKELIISGL